jgi:8-oxo-dGTP pyrophosphatase MutT (NUDIX family)
MAKEKLFQVGIKALITNDKDEILLLNTGDWHLKDQEAHWDIPGGRIQEGSDILETLHREVEEETGITGVADVHFFTAVIANFPDRDIDGHMVGLILMVYRVKIPQISNITLSEEHSGYEWAEPKEAAKRLSYKYPAEFTDLL